MIASRSGSGNGRTRRSPTRVAGEPLANARHAFWVWRRTRPFWGGLLIIFGAAEMLLSERASVPVVTHIGTQGMAGYLIPAFMALCGALLWLNPIDRILYSLVDLFLALGSWITSNLGGFFIGMLAGLIGGALAFAWTTDAEYEHARTRWFDGKPPLPWRPERLVLVIRGKGYARPELQGRTGPSGSDRLALPWAGQKESNAPRGLSEASSDSDVTACDVRGVGRNQP